MLLDFEVQRKIVSTLPMAAQFQTGKVIPARAAIKGIPARVSPLVSRRIPRLMQLQCTLRVSMLPHYDASGNSEYLIQIAAVYY
jgi:hypothetical protein